ncbi:Protein LUTEIN DEFICIENT 5, chloroplastic [Tetrabaena socialis]|uniref:Protein LUTEIN DEFICIENT 5, chloroplastic n=1 Tax=Tetrabaena socialis TaxID=47790 RepID=A0A2J8AIA5_9CHLO|nr:Protein LUTEIN DEFICIENT 5, chloroplastic [Tetrabaena socialis]|eukprot:PNH12250.1 Protein LUTEIN DEFICIENT 5, chloroplastic [Tetrabaena socialis]
MEEVERVKPRTMGRFVASQVALFGASAQHGLPQLEAAARSGGSVEMESFFSRLSLDIIGKAVFNYDFDSLTHDDPVIKEDLLCGQYLVPAGSNLFISVYNLQRSPQLWDEPDAFKPERFGPLDGPSPSEANTDFRYLPFGGGRRKCVGDQFAIMECTVALAVLLRRYDFKPDPSKPPVGVTTGATIHTSAGLHMLVNNRDMSGVPPPLPRSAGAPADSLTTGCPHAAEAAAVAAGPSAACPMGGA